MTPLAAKPLASPSITVTALPSLGGAAGANGINDGGTIVGQSIDAAGSGNAVKWTLQSGAWTVAQLPDGLYGSAAAINATGNIVGRGGDPHRAVLWPAAGGGSVVLGCAAFDFGPDAAVAINSGGTVAGYRRDGSITRAVVWRPGPGLCREDLPALVRGMSADARGIDDAGNVSGHAYDAAGKEWAVRWAFNGTSWNPPDTLKAGLYAGAWASNSGGDIAGSACLGTPPSGCQAHAVLWPRPGNLVRTDLGTLGGQVSAAFALNSTNEVVGWSLTSRNRSTHGFIWSTTTGMRGLGPLKGDSRSEAYGVNNAQSNGSRQVVGFSSVNSGTQRAVVWTVP
ncbi:MAG TPA: hypothetical protein VES88_13885 [Gemmatimonadaceae bacterium]|nr:hypothetical protein [Gemmatimonadaceae bacterium]